MSNNALQSFASQMTQLTPAEERRIRQEQSQQEAAIAQRIRQNMQKSGGGGAATASTLPPIAETNLTFSSSGSDSVGLANSNASITSANSSVRRSSPSNSIGTVGTESPRTNSKASGGANVTPNLQNSGHGPAKVVPITKINGGNTVTNRLGISIIPPAAGSSLAPSPRGVSAGSPTFTTLGGSVGNVVPAGYAESHGMLVCQEALKTVTGRKKNASPFDSNKYFPMLAASASAALKEKVLLCLDIDETLLHSTLVGPNTAPNGVVPSRAELERTYDAAIPIDGGDGARAYVCVSVRPNVKAFLEAISPLFEIAIFTASQSQYANMVMEVVDPRRRLLGPNRLYREHCAEVNGSRVKDLSLLGRPLHRVALLDNSPVTYSFQPRNAIPISSYFSDKGDGELLKLLPMLRRLAACESVYDVLDPYNAFLITPEPDEVLTLASPLSESPNSAAAAENAAMGGETDVHSPLASQHVSARGFQTTSTSSNSGAVQQRGALGQSNAKRTVSGAGGGTADDVSCDASRSSSRASSEGAAHGYTYTAGALPGSKLASGMTLGAMGRSTAVSATASSGSGRRSPTADTTTMRRIDSSSGRWNNGQHLTPGAYGNRPLPLGGGGSGRATATEPVRTTNGQRTHYV